MSSRSSYTEETFSFDNLKYRPFTSIGVFKPDHSPPPECGDIGGEVLFKIKNFDGVVNLVRKDLNNLDYFDGFYSRKT